MSNRYTVRIELDENGEECLPFPDELVAELGWKPGDIISWHLENNCWILKKKEDSDES